MKIHPLIADSASLAALVERMSAAPFVAVDTEFMRENSYWPDLCLIQIASPDEAAAIDPKAEVVVPSDGVIRRLPPGGRMTLSPGESVTLMPGVWHRFWTEEGDVLLGEVSTVNDDLTDNVFAEPVGRFSEIEEDEPPFHLLVSDYDRFLA